MSVNALNGTSLGVTQTGNKKSVFTNEEPVSIMEFDAGKTNKTIDIDQVSTDGSDDGKLSAGEIAKLAVKGAGEDTKNALLSPLGIAGMIGVTALALCPVTAPFVAPLAVAGAALGIGAGAIKTVSGVSKMVTADTDAEAKSGAKQTGSGVYTAATSAAAMKASLKQMSKVEGSHMEAAYRDKTSKTKAYFEDVKDLVSEYNPLPRKGNLSQDEIDELFKSYNAEQEHINANADTNMSQADIDDLLAQNGLGSNAPADSMSQADIDALLKELGVGPNYPTNNMSQYDIDKIVLQNSLNDAQKNQVADIMNEAQTDIDALIKTVDTQTAPTEINFGKNLPHYTSAEAAARNAAIRASGAPRAGDHLEILNILQDAAAQQGANAAPAAGTGGTTNPYLERLLQLAAGEDTII